VCGVGSLVAFGHLKVVCQLDGSLSGFSVPNIAKYPGFSVPNRAKHRADSSFGVLLRNGGLVSHQINFCTRCENPLVRTEKYATSSLRKTHFLVRICVFSCGGGKCFSCANSEDAPNAVRRCLPFLHRQRWRNTAKVDGPQRICSTCTANHVLDHCERPINISSHHCERVLELRISAGLHVKATNFAVLLRKLEAARYTANTAGYCRQGCGRILLCSTVRF